MAAIEDLELIIGRQIDEVDILNILEGHAKNLLDQVQLDPSRANELFDHNIQHRSKRINERLKLVDILQNHIGNERLKRAEILFSSEILLL